MTSEWPPGATVASPTGGAHRKREIDDHSDIEDGRSEPPVSGDALLAVLMAALVGLAILADAYLLGKGKHAICDKWLAKGQADCAGGDGFREWFPYVVRTGLILVVGELALIPLVVYVAGRIDRSSRAN